MNKHCCQSRILDTNGLAIQLSDRVVSYRMLDVCPRGVNLKNDGIPDNAAKPILSLACLLSWCMVPNIERSIINELNRIVRIF